MNLDNLKPSLIGSFRRGRKVLDKLINLLHAHLPWFRRHVAVRNRRRRNHVIRPTALLDARNGIVVPLTLGLERRQRRSLSPRMSELHGGYAALGFDKRRNGRPRFSVIVGPDARVLRRDATVCLHACCLGHHYARTTNGQSAEMNEMPRIGHSIFGRVFAHWRDHDAVL